MNFGLNISFSLLINFAFIWDISNMIDELLYRHCISYFDTSQ